MRISFIFVALNAGGCLGLLLDDLRAQTLPPEQEATRIAPVPQELLEEIEAEH